MQVDLHCHSTASDGALTPDALVALAAERGADLLAITDHDTAAGCRALPVRLPVAFLPGIELSCRWRDRTLHVLGLGIDPEAAILRAAEAHQRALRFERAERIAARLAARGVPAPLEGALAQANGAAPGRVHFARHLVACGFAADEAQAFRRHLGDGRDCAVPVAWPALETAVAWIRAAGGEAVLAHPARSRLGGETLRQLAADFAASGGSGLEVVCGAQPPAVTRRLAALCRATGLAASCGSDFHHPAQHWLPFGRTGLPADLKPIWERRQATWA